jgi:GNAT superfamily N-acetyltransferase
MRASKPMHRRRADAGAGIIAKLVDWRNDGAAALPQRDGGSPMTALHSQAPAMTAALALRRATAADADAIRTLVRVCYAKWVPLIGREPKPMTADYGCAIREHLVYVHQPPEGLLGVLELIRHPDFLLVENIAVSPAAQGRGLGRALMAEAERVAHDLVLHEMRLYTNARFETNIRLYEAIGYTISERAPIPGGGEVVWMRKLLS